MPFDLGDDAALLVPALCLVMEVFEEPFDLGQRRAPDRPGQPVRDLLAKHGIGGQPDGVEVARLFEPCVDRGAGISGVGAVDVAVPQRTAFQHSELVEHKERMVAGAVEMPVPGGALLLAMGRADRTVHVQRYILQPIAVMKSVNPLTVQIGQRRPVLR
jgi:hypothetical protein